MGDDGLSGDVFTFRKRSFQGGGANSDESDSDSDGDAGFFLEKKKTKSLLERVDNDSEDDDDSVEVTGEVKPKTHVSSAERAIPVLDDDSSDDEQNYIPKFGEKHFKNLQILEQSRQAKANLERSQNYHAEDIDVDDTPTGRSYELPSESRLGKRILIEIQIFQETNLGATCSTQKSTKNGYIRRNEPFQALINRLRGDGLKVPSASDPNATIQLENNGIALELTKAPATYEISPNDDGSQLSFVLRFSTRTPISVKANLGGALDLKLRTQRKGVVEAEETFTLRSKETFSILLHLTKKKKGIASCTNVVLGFDGEALGLQETPETHDMESGDLIDVQLK